MKQPRQGYWKPQHEVFIKSMLLHGDKIQAYKEAYPNISPAAVRQAVCRLLSHPRIRQRLDALKDAREAAVKELEEKTQQRVSQQLLTAYEQRLFLANIILGHTKLQRQIKLRDRVVEVEEDLDAYVILRAIELDCKLEAGYQWPVHQDAINRQIDRLANYLNSANHQGVGVCKQTGDSPADGEANTDKGVTIRKQIETDSGSKRQQQSISHFAQAPFVTKKAA